MARFGRFIGIQGTLSPAEHAESRDAFIEAAEELRQRQSRRRDRLIEILQKADPIDLLGRACFTYLPIDPDTYKEWESDRSPAHIEYLALQALSVGLDGRESLDPVEATNLTSEALHLSREMFRDATMLLAMDATRLRRDEPENEEIQYVLKTRMESLAVRGEAYEEHLLRVLHGCLDPFEDDCRRLLGFSLNDAIRLWHAIPQLFDERVRPRWEEASVGVKTTLTELKRDRRRGRSDMFPDWMLALTPTEAKAQVAFMGAAFVFANARSLVTVTPAELAQSSGVDLGATDSFLEAFTCPPGDFNPEHHAMPSGAHPLTAKPILKCDDGYVLPVPSTFSSAIRPRMEDLLRPDQKVWDRYADRRGEWLEREATELLAGALPGSKSWRSIKWKSPATESDLDGLVGADDLTLRVQCKAGRVSAPARRGALVSMRRQVGDLIEQAAVQHGALRAALAEASPVAIGFSPEQERALQAMYQFEVVVCLDDVTVWATVAHELRSIELLPPGGPVPWVLSLTDLMAVVDLLDGPQLAHYLMRRQRLERDGRIEAHDELDWVGHYVSEGLYFDPHFEGDNPPALFRLLSYTEHIDAWYFSRAGARTVETPKPEQPIPPNVAALLSRLAGQRPEHWITAAVAVLDFGDDGREQWDQFIQHISTHVPQRGWSNASMVAHENLGLTIYVDLRPPPAKLRSFLVGYCKEKAESLDEPNWIAIGEASSGGLFVLLEQHDPVRTLADVFQTPAGILSEADSKQSLEPDDEEGQAATTAEGEAAQDGTS